MSEEMAKPFKNYRNCSYVMHISPLIATRMTTEQECYSDHPQKWMRSDTMLWSAGVEQHSMPAFVSLKEDHRKDFVS